MRWVAWFILACLLGIGAVVLVVWLSGGFEGTGLNVSIALALALGILFTSLLGVGLMALIFYSNRSGQDEEAHRSARLVMDDAGDDAMDDGPDGDGSDAPIDIPRPEDKR
jgi:hypothetical protein